MIQSRDLTRYRWPALAFFILSTSINYLDRQTLAHLAPMVQAEFGLSDAQYGMIISAFSIPYTVCAPLAGMLIDRIGLYRGASLMVGLWSMAGIATGFTRGLGGLLGCRAALGMAEAGGIPATGKAVFQYLLPKERAVGTALNQVAVSLGLIAAPPIATWLAYWKGWRAAFVLTGLLGLAWIPAWMWIARRAPAQPAPAPAAGSGRALLRDRRLWAFMAANGVSMIGYSLWTSWTTKFLVRQYALTVAQAAWYAWIPPLVATVGGLAGGALSLRLAARGVAPPAARFRVCLWASAASLVTAAIPLAATPAWATAGISLSFAAVSAFSVNMYALPLDVFGGARAAFAISTLTASYGAMQTLVSVGFGKVADLWGYAPLTVAVSITPAMALAILWYSRSTR